MSLQVRRTEVSIARRVAMLTGCAAVLTATCGSALAFRIGISAPQPQVQSTHAPGTDPLQVSSGIMAGRSITKVPPVYPQTARDARIMGSVVLSARIDADGHVENIAVLSGPPELQDSALTAVRQWVYEPFEVNGSPVSVETTITVNYQLAE